jgi:hypothetical protein
VVASGEASARLFESCVVASSVALCVDGAASLLMHGGNLALNDFGLSLSPSLPRSLSLPLPLSPA